MDVYENPALQTHAVANEVLENAVAGLGPTVEPNSVLVGLALYDEDRAFVERWCHRIAHQCADLWLIGTASLCLGHLARRFGHLEPDSITLVRQLAERRDLDSRVISALEDVTFFLEELPSRRTSDNGRVTAAPPAEPEAG